MRSIWVDTDFKSLSYTTLSISRTCPKSLSLSAWLFAGKVYRTAIPTLRVTVCRGDTLATAVNDHTCYLTIGIHGHTRCWLSVHALKGQ